jgi:hypothetical protein
MKLPANPVRAQPKVKADHPYVSYSVFWRRRKEELSEKDSNSE